MKYHTKCAGDAPPQQQWNLCIRSFCLTEVYFGCFPSIVNDCSSLIVSLSGVQSIDTYLSVKWTHTTRVNLFSRRRIHIIDDADEIGLPTQYNHFKTKHCLSPVNICLSTKCIGFKLCLPFKLNRWDCLSVCFAYGFDGFFWHQLVNFFGLELIKCNIVSVVTSSLVSNGHKCDTSVDFEGKSILSSIRISLNKGTINVQKSN